MSDNAGPPRQNEKGMQASLEGDLSVPTKSDIIQSISSGQAHTEGSGDVIIHVDDTMLVHRDPMGRYSFLNRNDRLDRYLKPRDSRLAVLNVQISDTTQPAPTWNLVELEDKTPSIIKWVCFTFESVPEVTRGSDVAGRLLSQESATQNQASGSEVSSGGRKFLSKEWRHIYFSKRWLKVYGKWPFVCICLLGLMVVPMTLEGQFKNNGFYDPVRYRDWGYPKAARNLCENKSSLESNAQVNAQIENDEFDEEFDEDFDNLPARHLRPRYLCFLKAGCLKKGARPEMPGYEVRKVTDWLKEHGEKANMEYILVSYTRKQHRQGHADLLRTAQKAARAVSVSAFWIDFECMSERNLKEDIWRICDVVRGARSLIIALGPPTDETPDEGRLLKEWGKRLWTLPELLLSPSQHDIEIYGHGRTSTKPRKLAKRNFAAQAWDDAKVVRQLVDHYEGSLILTPLELVSIALQCLLRRQTDKYHHGDESYALMGLLRRRPTVNENDSSFEAFARLSLANDSNLLLERLICMLPPSRDLSWDQMKDAWGANLWDIDPICQVAGIVDDQTVLLDGAFGATIRWKSLAPVAFIKRKTWIRTLGKICVRGTPTYFLAGILLLATSRPFPGVANPMIVIGAIFLTFSLVLILASPYLLLTIYKGKFWGTQAWFFGIEGEVDLAKIEEYLFGIRLDRLKWSTNGSTLSRHRLRGEECVALTPTPTASHSGSTGHNTNPEAEPTAEYPGPNPRNPRSNTENWRRPDHTPTDRERVFTLVDTYTMTATMFYAVRPPTAVLICGREGGMQRAVLCSYDWQTQTFCRETVLRMKTIVLEKMFRVDRFRFALGRN